MITYKTIEETTKLWVSQFNCVPLEMVELLARSESQFREVTIASKDTFYDKFPMWGWMWQFSDSLDDYWLKEEGGIATMSELGFRIYESEEFGYFFGIDGAGYDFYEVHWIPLYRARGLLWHVDEGCKD